VSLRSGSPIVDGLIQRCMKRFKAKYFEQVHQELSPLARDLEMALRRVGAERALEDIEHAWKDRP
jgi:hypothetical protein